MFEKNEFIETPKVVVSACGCDKDHHDGKFISAPYKGKRIYFCAQNCKDEFIEDPEKFLHSDHFVLNFDLLEDE